MAVTFVCGFEAQQTATDGLNAFSGTASYNTSVVRTGSASCRCNPASTFTGFPQFPTAGDSFFHFALRVATFPSVARLIQGSISADFINVRLQTDGTLKVYLNATLIGTSSTALVADTWYWIGVRHLTGTSVPFLQIDGVDQVTGTATVTGTSGGLGFRGSEASAADAYFDDIVWDNAAFLAPSKVALLLPVTDNAVGTGWTNDAAGTTNLFTAVDSTPPIGIADTSSGTGLNQIRNATANANSNYDANLTTYTAAGVASGDTVLALRPIVATAAPVSTSAKQGTVGVASNPAIANIALGAGGTAGAFWSGAAGATYVTGWKVSFGTFTTLPSVTLGTAPVMRITQVTSSTRIAVVCFMAMYMAWTPAVAARVPYVNPMPPLIAQ
jgi:hypothetical protein